MAAEGPRALAFFLLVLNLILYVIVLSIAGWAINFSIEHTPQIASELEIPVRFFPIYVPMGNMASGFFIIFSLISGIVGAASSIAGINNISQWNMPNLLSATTSSVAAWTLTLLAMGLACKEISIGGREDNLRALEALTIILSGTQLLCVIAVHSGVLTMSRSLRLGGRV